MGRRIHTLLLAAVAALAIAGTAEARGGNYVFAGGTPAQQRQVTAALEASSFDWSLVRQQITVRIAPGVDSEASPGTIVLDANLLDSGKFAWGVVQHEYAHQVDFFLLGDQQRTQLLRALGGSSWWQRGGLAHGQLASERFASTLAWAYWQSPQNAMKPAGPTDESGSVAPAAFRQLAESLLGVGVTPLGVLPTVPSNAPRIARTARS